MFKKIVLAFCSSIIICIGYHSLTFLATPILHGTFNQQELTSQSKPTILISCLAKGMGGAETHVLKLLEKLEQNHYPIIPLVEHNSPFSTYLTDHAIAHYTTRTTQLGDWLRTLHHVLFGWCLKSIYKQHPFNIVHCNNRTEVPGALSVAKKHSVRVILTRHVPDHFDTKRMRNIDAIVGVSPQITNYFEQENKTKKLNIKHIVTIPPLYNQEHFLSFSPTSSKQEFFFNDFGITVSNNPVITMIANFYGNLNHKNHTLLIEAIDTLVNKEHQSIHVMLAGDGESRKHIEKIVKDRNLTNTVHFLGPFFGRNNKIPELLYHSDIMVLTSKNEAFGIVYLEAGIMKKPSIGAYGTGAESIIVHEQTGLLFKNNDCADLVTCIKRLLDNPKQAQQLGKNARKHVLDNFSPEVTFKKYEELYKAIHA